MDEGRPMKIPGHITVNEGGPTRYDLECSVCSMGYSGGSRFGMVNGSDLAAAFIWQHAIHDKKGNPSGLTPGGKPRAAALAALR